MTIYLDHNATTPLKPTVIDTMMGVLRESGNASSLHSAGRTARKHIEDARADVAGLVKYNAANVIFTSGATEANNMILQGHRGTVLVSAIEHPSVLNVREDAVKIPVTHDGVVDLVSLENLLTQHRPQLVAVMAINNETGVIQPVPEIGRLCKKVGALFHCDAVQAAGKIMIDFEAWGCDFLTLSAHKCGGPQGAGALVFKSKTPVPRLLLGGGHERRQRAGTENVAGIAGFGMAARLAVQDMAVYQSLEMLRNKLETSILSSRTSAARSGISNSTTLDPGLRRDDGGGVVVHSNAAPRVAGVSCFSMPDKHAQTLLMQLDLAGICVSSGSACSSGSITASHVLQAMGVTDDLCAGALRVSMGWNTTEGDIAALIAALQSV